jgi:hypothetical protein
LVYEALEPAFAAHLLLWLSRFVSRDQASAGGVAAVAGAVVTVADAGQALLEQPVALAAPVELHASEDPVPTMSFGAFACLPRRLRQRFLKMIHTFTKDVFV